jgi:hypothetical protein
VFYYEYELDNSGSIPEATINIVQETVTAMTRNTGIWPKPNDDINDVAEKLADVMDEEIVGDLIHSCKENKRTSTCAREDMPAMVEAKSTLIAKDTKRGPANVIMVGTKEMADAIACSECLDEHAKVVVSKHVPPNTLILARKGQSLIESGYTYQPYVMPLMYSQDGESPYCMRYAKKMLVPENYYVIEVE